MTDTEIAYFGAGCFWNSELVYHNKEGVLTTEVGCCTFPLENEDGESRVEVVKVEYDSDQITLEELVNIFWTTHNTSSEKNADHNYVERSMLLARHEEQFTAFQNELQKYREKSDDKVYTAVSYFTNYKKAAEKDQGYYF